MSRWSRGLAGGLVFLVAPLAFADEPAAKGESEAARAGRAEAVKDAAAAKAAEAKVGEQKTPAMPATTEVLERVLAPAADAKASGDTSAPSKPAPKVEIAPMPGMPAKEQEAFENSMKGFADELRKQMTDLGQRMAKDIKAQLTPEVEKRISDAMNTLKKETSQPAATKTPASETPKKGEATPSTTPAPVAPAPAAETEKAKDPAPAEGK